MRLWPIAVLATSFVFGVAACGSGGSGDSKFTGLDDSGIQSEYDSGSVTLGVGDGGAEGGPSGCQPKTCVDLGATCGPQGDGCGGIIDGGCGSCTNGQTCGGGGTGTSVCGGQSCVPKTCAAQGIGCGPANDGCGNLLNCYPDDAGSCPPGETCGGGGAFQCGTGIILDSGAPDAASCVPTTCQVGQCGPTTNGCGAPLDCGGCDGGICGYPTSFFCGYAPSGAVDGGLCVPKTCAQQGLSCGLAGDGCGNVINCWPTSGAGADGGSCLSGEVCGLYDAGQCGAPKSTATDGGSACVASKTCAGLNCGFIDDGCGNVLDCWPNGGTPDAGASCAGFNTCGGGGVSNVCGGSSAPTDGGSLCSPLTCAQQNISCGSAGDGCGHTLNCYADGGASCGPTATCETSTGGAVQCVSNTTICTPSTCAAQKIACGSAGDGCGHTLNCYADGGASCGGSESCITVDGGTVECVSPTTICKPTTCAALGYTCGYAGDTCGDLLDCNASDAGCPSPEYCGGGGANLCGFGYSGGDGGTGYTVCPGTTVTSITGRAFAATDPSVFDVTGVTPDPLSGAYVWVSSTGVLPAITPGITCTQCSDPATALAVAITNPDGSFTLPNVPVVAGQTSVPIVVQVGRWARLLSVPITACQSNAIADYTLRLPRNSTEGNMPWLAFNTGSVDSLECVLLKMGIQQGMFAAPATVTSDMTSGTGGTPKAGGTRVAIYTSPDAYQGAALGGAYAPDGTNTTGANLYTSPTTLDEFDAVLFPCVGREVTTNKSAANIQDVVNYANSGGRFFATHYSYVWAFDDYADAPAPTATTRPAYAWGCTTGTDGTYTVCNTTGDTVGEWDPEQTIGNDVTVNVDTTTASGQAFGQWMVDLGAGALASGALADGGVGAGTSVTFDIENARWDLNSVNTKAQQWAYYDNGSGSEVSVQQMTFNTPVNAASTAQCGRVVFSDFHVNNNSDNAVTFPEECTDGASATVSKHLPPLTSQERALEYMLFNLTSCVSPTNTTDTCVPKTCASYPAGTCGEQSDGCGNFITCATCPAGETCGGGGVSNQCGGCTKRTCAYYGTNVCGTQSDGCGGTVTCDTCTLPATCGGGGVADQCGACTPKTCAAYPGKCGQQADGCGGLTTACNPCTSPETCGGAGTPDVCGVPDASVCTPKTCASYPAGTCGQQSNGCGGLLASCTTCTLPATCGGGGVSNACGSPDSGACVPLTCSAFPSICGQQADGCGGLTAYCNPCSGTLTCGGGGTSGVCGSGSCAPTTCAAQSIQCGPAGDGCGGALDCGPCPTGQTCGGGGVSGVCGGCSPITCSTAGVGCGTNGDGCGGQITCSCPTGETCGGGGVAGACGSTSCVPATCAGLNLTCGYEADGCGNLLDCGTCTNGATCTNGTCTGGNTGPK